MGKSMTKINGMTVIESNLLENWGTEDHPPYDEVEGGHVLRIPLGFESWFIPAVVRPVMPTPPEPVVVAVPEEPDPWSAWAAGISELFNTLAPVAVGLLAVMLLVSLGE